VDEFGPDPSALVLERLTKALGTVCGKLRASDALALAGFDQPTYRRAQLVKRALLSLGWERGRFRYNGTLLYAYARGTPLEREVMLEVCRDADDRLVVKRMLP
jgi:hypothetical protein